MKISGAEFIDWYDNHWPGDNWYHDDANIEIHDDEGAWLLDPAEMYDIDDLGAILYQGPDDHPDAAMADTSTLAGWIRKYRKARDFDVLTVTCPKELTATVKETLAAVKGVKIK
jgi:hypothetical protein